MPMTAEAARPMTMAWTPATAAPVGSFSPIRRATMAVVERLKPRPMAKTRLRSDSVRPTVATASAPRRPTQKTSTTAKRDSSTISMTMGMASRRIARLRLPVVKSWCEPRRASRTELQNAGGGLNEYSDLGDEHGRCPWRCLCVSTAPDVRIFTDTYLDEEILPERRPG